MNQNDINRAFTEKVTELLSRGYQIHPGTMGGSQGEIAHVDLYKGDEIIRVLLDHSAGHGEKPDGIRLIVGRNTDRIRMNCFDKLGNTIWKFSPKSSSARLARTITPTRKAAEPFRKSATLAGVHAGKPFAATCPMLSNARR